MLFPTSTDELGDWAGDLNTEPPARLMARILAALFAAGATLALITLVISSSPDAEPVGLVSIVAAAYMVAAGLWRLTKVPSWLLPTTIVWGTASITGVAWFSGDTVSPLIFFYLWVFLYSAYFFKPVMTTLQIAWVGACYAGLLAAGQTPEAPEITWWLVGMGSLLVGALVVALMRSRVELLIGQLFESARRDPLTQLINRRGFRELLDLELEQARRTGAPMSVLLGDADRFKSVNDISGHQVGDEVLRRLAEVLLERHGQSDTVARIGGEEFALVLPSTDETFALEIAEELRCRVQQEFDADQVPITISFGIATFPVHGETSAALLRAGDEALYVAKQNGRNGSVVHLPEHTSARVHSPGHTDGTDGTDEAISAERFIGVMLDLAETVDRRFSGTARHSETVGRYAELMARRLGLDEERVVRVRLAGLLHDIGKVAISDAILHKTGPLTDHQYDKVKEHPALGASILEHPSLGDIRNWVAAHHERPDGRGYPRGISGDELPLEARIVAVADAYEAMTAVRSYKVSMTPTEAFAELRAEAGAQFDPRVVEALIDSQGSASGAAPNGKRAHDDKLNEPEPTSPPTPSDSTEGMDVGAELGLAAR